MAPFLLPDLLESSRVACFCSARGFLRPPRRGVPNPEPRTLESFGGEFEGGAAPLMGAARHPVKPWHRHGAESSQR